MKIMLRKWWLIPLCVLTYYVSRIIGLLIIYLIDGITGSAFLAFFIGILISGVGAAMPIIIVTHKSEKLKAGVKLTINIVSVLLFSALMLMTLITPKKEIEEFHRQQQEWENKQLQESTDIKSSVQ
ncbi:MAG: hypothetical protein IKT67_07425 [Lachnospiraceae bacterium]|nr:hypothetical protein [Lachnospiraceae bacterium]